MCVAFIQLLLPPIDIQHTQCPCRFVIPRERQRLCSHKLQGRVVALGYTFLLLLLFLSGCLRCHTLVDTNVPCNAYSKSNNNEEEK